MLKKQHERHLKAVQAYAIKPRQTKCTFSQEEMLKESCATEVSVSLDPLNKVTIGSSRSHLCVCSTTTRGGCWPGSVC